MLRLAWTLADLALCEVLAAHEIGLALDPREAGVAHAGHGRWRCLESPQLDHPSQACEATSTMTESECIARAALSGPTSRRMPWAWRWCRSPAPWTPSGSRPANWWPGLKLERELFRPLAANGPSAGWSGLGMVLKRWLPRTPDLGLERDLATMQRLGGRMIIPSDGLGPSTWPTFVPRAVLPLVA